MSISQSPSEDLSVAMDTDESHSDEYMRAADESDRQDHERAVQELHQQRMEWAVQYMAALREHHNPAAEHRHQAMESAWHFRLQHNVGCLSLLSEGDRESFWVQRRMLASQETHDFQWGVTCTNPFSVQHDHAYYMSLFREQMNYDSMSSEQIGYFQATASVPGWFRAPPNSLATADAPPMNTTPAPPLAAFNAALEMNIAFTGFPWRTHHLDLPYRQIPPRPLRMTQARAPASSAGYSVPTTPFNTPARSNTPMSILPESESDKDWIVPPTPFNSPQKPKVASIASATHNKTMLDSDMVVPPTPFNSPQKPKVVSSAPATDNKTKLDKDWVVPPTPFNSPQKPKAVRSAPPTGNKTKMPPRTLFNPPEHSRSASPIWVVTPIGTRADGTKLTPSSSYHESPFQRKSEPELSSSELRKSSTPEEKFHYKGAPQPIIPDLAAIRRSGGFRFGGSDQFHFGSPERPTLPLVFGDNEGSSDA